MTADFATCAEPAELKDLPLHRWTESYIGLFGQCGFAGEWNFYVALAIFAFSMIFLSFLILVTRKCKKSSKLSHSMEMDSENSKFDTNGRYGYYTTYGGGYNTGPYILAEPFMQKTTYEQVRIT